MKATNKDHHASLGLFLVRATAGLFSIKLVGIGLTFLSTVVLARILGPNAFGVYAFALAILMVLMPIAALGLPEFFVRMFARYEFKNQWDLMRGLFKLGTLAVFLVSVLVALLVSGVAWLYEGVFAGARTATVWMTMAMLPGLALTHVHMGVLRGLRYVVVGQVPDLLIKPGVLMALVMIMYFSLGASAFDETVAVLMLLVAVYSSCVVSYVLMWYRLPHDLLNAPPKHSLSVWAAGIIPLVVVSAMQGIKGHTDVVVLGLFVGSEAVGVYQAAAQISVSLALVQMVITMAQGPTISRLWAAGEVDRLQRIISLGTITAFFVALPLTFFFVTYSSLVLEFVYGVEYTIGAVALTILCIGRIAHVAIGPMLQILIMTGHENDALVSVVVAALLNLALNLALVPFWGIEGAAFATSTSLFVWNAILAWRVYRRTNIVPFLFAIKRAQE